MTDRAERIYRCLTIALVAVIVLGTLGFNVLLCVANKRYDPGSYTYKSDPDAFQKRIELRELADKVYITTEKIFNRGISHVALVFLFIGKRVRFPRMILAIAIVPAALYLCSIPFVLLDGSSTGGWIGYTQNVRQILLNFIPSVVTVLVANAVKYAIEYIRTKRNNV